MTLTIYEIVPICISVLSMCLSAYSLGIRQGRKWEREDATESQPWPRRA